MNRRFVIVGTDTDVGKTVVSAALVGALNACYWKPVQSGLDGETDSQIVARLSGAAADRIFPEAWRLRRPASAIGDLSVLCRCSTTLRIAPHRLASYVHELAGMFHKYYAKYKIVNGKSPDLSLARLYLISAVQIVISISLD